MVFFQHLASWWGKAAAGVTVSAPGAVLGPGSCISHGSPAPCSPPSTSSNVWEVHTSGLETSPSICAQSDQSWLHPTSPGSQGPGGAAFVIQPRGRARAQSQSQPESFFPRALHSVCCQIHPKVSVGHVGHRLPRNVFPVCQHGEAAVPSPRTALVPQERSRSTTAPNGSFLRPEMELSLHPGQIYGKAGGSPLFPPSLLYPAPCRHRFKTVPMAWGTKHVMAKWQLVAPGPSCPLLGEPRIAEMNSFSPSSHLGTGRSPSLARPPGQFHMVGVKPLSWAWHRAGGQPEDSSA